MIRISSKYMLPLFCLLLSTGYAAGPDKVRSVLKFEEEVWNFGQIEELDGPVSHTFSFTNTGTKPVVIEDVSVSCGCTTPEYSRAPILPGRTGTIRITYDPANRPGPFNKEIYIICANRTSRNMISVRGEVIPRPRTVEDDYPVSLLSGLRINGMSVNFSYVGQGTARSMVLRYANTSDRNVTLSAAADPACRWLKIAGPVTVRPEEKGELTFTCDLTSEKLWGMAAAKVYLTIDGKRFATPLSVTTIGTDDFSALSPREKERGPRARLDSQFYNFSDVRQGARVSRRFTLSNEGEAPLIVRAVEVKPGISCTLQPGTEIAPHSQVSFDIRLDLSEYGKGRLFRSVTLVMNDPNRPLREIRLTANLK